MEEISIFQRRINLQDQDIPRQILRQRKEYSIHGMSAMI